MSHSQLHTLPDELVDLIIAYLPYNGLCNLSIVSRWCYTRAVPFLWRNLKLVDTETTFKPPEDPNATQGVGSDQQVDLVIDQHDETRILQKLFILATNPYVASKVQTILHRCHLPTPELFQELPDLRHDDWISYPTHNQDGSQHYGPYVRLVLQAVANMVNVHTIRIVLGHCGLTQALVWGFFGPHRKASVPVRKLWLESCCIRSPSYHHIWTPLDLSRVESLRLRRLWLQSLPTPTSLSDVTTDTAQYYYTRESHYRSGLRNSTAGYYDANIVYTQDPTTYEHLHYAERAFHSIMSHFPSVSFLQFVQSLATDSRLESRQPVAAHQETRFDWLRSAYKIRSLGSALRLLAFYPDSVRTALYPQGQLESVLGHDGFSISVRGEHSNLGAWQNTRLDHAYFNASSCLTSLNLDWVVFHHKVSDLGHIEGQPSQRWSVLSRLCSLTFPNLQAFQMRNCITPSTHLGSDIFLFATPLGSEKGLIDFLEAHMNLQCLAWPMAHFFPPQGVSADLTERVSRVIMNLGRTVTDLRVDAMLTNPGELSTDPAETMGDVRWRRSRRLFITDFAAHMSVLESIKMEGGIPRDEKRETTRALSRCPLNKLVHIGASFPLGNTWGEDGRYLREHDDESVSYMTLEEEDEDMLQRSVSWSPPTTTSDNNHFSAHWGKDYEPALYTIASHHAETIRELKFCGYNGAPMLRHPSRVTTPILHHLKQFHGLQELVMSFWVHTFFDGGARDEAIIKYWLDMRTPSSTALAIIRDETTTDAVLQSTDDDPEVNPIHEAAAAAPLDAASWLYDNYHPQNLANKIKDFLGPYLSRVAKSQPGGVQVRASFCLGSSVQDIFDFDVRLGTDPHTGVDAVLEYLGPREDSWDGGRSEEKLEKRRWF